MTRLDCYSLSLRLCPGQLHTEPRSPKLIHFLTEHTRILQQDLNCISVPIILMTITYCNLMQHSNTKGPALRLNWPVITKERKYDLLTDAAFKSSRESRLVLQEALLWCSGYRGWLHFPPQSKDIKSNCCSPRLAWPNRVSICWRFYRHTCFLLCENFN